MAKLSLTNWIGVAGAKILQALRVIPKPKPIKPVTMPDKPLLQLSLEKFTSLTTVVIDNFESGYYHPHMMSYMSAADRKVLAASGETMFGLDRKAGAELAKYPEWAEFWSVIDKAGAATKWKHYYLGGEYAPQLKRLASAIMYKWFSYLAGKYILISSMDEIAEDDRLIIHFSYASWNGAGWFQKFSTALNNAVLKYEGNKELIFTEAIKARTQATNKYGVPNKTIRNQGIKMMALFKKMKLV